MKKLQRGELEAAILSVWERAAGGEGFFPALQSREGWYARAGGAGTAAPAKNTLVGVPAAPGSRSGRFSKNIGNYSWGESYGTPAEEHAWLQQAIEKARRQLALLHQQMLASNTASEAAIFEVHLELLDDAELLDAVLARIQKEQSAARAWQATINERAQIVAALKDPLLSARAADLHDVGYRVIRNLVGVGEQGYNLPDQPVVVIAQDLSPSDTASLDRSGCWVSAPLPAARLPYRHYRPPSACRRWSAPVLAY
jgi:signal transduction protein with GAF and PtsI domain